MIKALRAAEQRQRQRAAGAETDGSTGQGDSGSGGIGPGEPYVVSGASFVGGVPPSPAQNSAPGMDSRYLARRGPMFLRRLRVPLAVVGLVAGGALLWLDRKSVV